MKLNKASQYGVLFSLYLARSGRTTVDVAAENLGVSFVFLQQIAHRMKLCGVLTSYRGIGGGYELNGDPTVGQILTAIEPTKLLTEKEKAYYQKGGSEARAFVSLCRNLNKAMAPILSRKIRNVGNELAANEVARLNRLNDSTATVN